VGVREIDCEYVNSMELVQNSVHWRASEVVFRKKWEPVRSMSDPARYIYQWIILAVSICVSV
jgi:hypothetical protein